MNIKILCVGKLSEKFFKDACDEYKKRISAFSKIEIIDIPEEKILTQTPSKLEIENVLKKRFINIRMHELPFDISDISSTDIRKKIAEGEKDSTKLNINKKVMDYILRYELYKENQNGWACKILRVTK